MRSRFSIAFLLAATACGNVTTSGSGTSAVKACGDMAAALCAKRASCTNGAGIVRTNGDMQTCVSREELTCMTALAAPDSGNNPDKVEQCVAAYAMYSCTDFLNGNPPAVCIPMGPRAVGAPCAFNGQCASAFCGRNKTSTCGTCANPPMPGDSCAASPCGHDQACVSKTMACAVYVDLNVACGADAPCGAGLNCVPPNQATSSCQLAIANAGATCGAGSNGCDGTFGLSCTGTVGSKTCTAIVFGGDGTACGLMADGTRGGCKAGGCYTTTGLAGPEEAGTCRADAADGSPCDSVLGPGCQAPARCVVVDDAGTAGTCLVPDATTCG
jgi:hypothetical protein